MLQQNYKLLQWRTLSATRMLTMPYTQAPALQPQGRRSQFQRGLLLHWMSPISPGGEGTNRMQRVACMDPASLAPGHGFQEQSRRVEAQAWARAGANHMHRLMQPIRTPGWGPWRLRQRSLLGEISPAAATVTAPRAAMNPPHSAVNTLPPVAVRGVWTVAGNSSAGSPPGPTDPTAGRRPPTLRAYDSRRIRPPP